MHLRLATLLTFAAGPALATGFQFVEIPSTADVPHIEAAVWYPSDAAVPDAPNTPFGQAVAMHAPVAGGDLPLVVVSHGDGGWFGGHADLARALAKAGMIAVALNHPGNSDGDETAPPSRWITERPRHLARVVEYMSSDWPDADLTKAVTCGGVEARAINGASASAAASQSGCLASPQSRIPPEAVLTPCPPTTGTPAAHGPKPRLANKAPCRFVARG